MPKLLWVVAPLLIALAWWAIQVLRGRTPSRHALNVWSSILLLGYVLATAGLGIFWVASQQLPVFDWHYLFGYGSLLLIALHLAFNFRVIWRHLTQARPGRSRQVQAGRPVAAGQRRRALTWGAAALAGGAALWLIVQRGRDEPVARGSASDAPGGTPEPSASALAAVERFHAVSSNSRRGLLLRAPDVDWGGSPSQFKRYPGAARVGLPAPGRPVASDFGAGTLGQVLWHTSGVTERRSGLVLRASPSSGALFPAELYVLVRSLPGLADGLWHYDADAHALESLGSAPAGLDAAALGVEPAAGTRAFVIATAVFRRTGHKYRDRTYRYVLADLGHALENLRVASESAGVGVTFPTAFDQARLAAGLGIDESEEGVIAVVALDAARAGPRPPPGPSATPLWQPAAPPDPRSAALGVTASVHAATSLRLATPAPVGAARAVAARGPDGGSVALPRATLAAADMARVIAQRRSVRRFSGRPMPLDDLAGVFARMTAPGPTFSGAIRIDVVVHAVAGLAPGAYRFEPTRRALTPRGARADLRAAARAAGLDQDVIGDAGVVIVLSIDRGAFAADPLGPARGYRHGFLEAGMMGERVYLEAGGRRLGACSVGAFYDDEAAALLHPDPAREWAVHFVALGIPSGQGPG